MFHKLLLDEPPLVVIPSLAKAIGLNEAIVLQQVHYWLQINAKKQSGSHYHEGRYWTYNTAAEWAETFPFWGESTVRRIFASLEKSGIFLKGFFNEKSSDRTKWTSIDYDCLDRILSGNSPHRSKSLAQVEQMGCSNLADQSCSNLADLPYTETNTETNYREYGSNAHEPKLFSLHDRSEKSDPVITSSLLTQSSLTTTTGKAGSAPVVQMHHTRLNPHPIDLQRWMTAFNSNAPTKWPKLSIGFFMAPRTQEAIRGYMAGYGSEDEALPYFIGALAYIRVSEDPWWRNTKVSGGVIFNPDKLPLAQFFQAAEDSNVNAAAVAASGLTDQEIKERSAMERVLKERADRLREANEYRARIGAPLLESL